MPEMKWPPISLETLVETTKENHDVTDWMPEARISCRWGVQGRVVAHHDSHGLSYEVRHSDGTIGHYDPSELKVVELSREEMVEKLMWNSGGTGFGICSFASELLWQMDQPGPDKPDLISVVAVGAPPDNYTDEELAKLVAFSEERTARYDKMFRYRRGANLIIIHKTEDGQRWLRKRLSWDRGQMYSPTLEEAIAVMSK